MYIMPKKLHDFAEDLVQNYFWYVEMVAPRANFPTIMLARKTKIGDEYLTISLKGPMSIPVRFRQTHENLYKAEFYHPGSDPQNPIHAYYDQDFNGIFAHGHLYLILSRSIGKIGD